MDIWRLVAERKIEEAMEEGAFENLEGAGRPIPLDDDSLEDPGLRMAHRLLRNNGFAPAWIEEAKEIESAATRLRADLERAKNDPQAWEALRKEVAALNRRIAIYNLKAPTTAVHKPPLRP